MVRPERTARAAKRRRATAPDKRRAAVISQSNDFVIWPEQHERSKVARRPTGDRSGLRKRQEKPTLAWCARGFAVRRAGPILGDYAPDTSYRFSHLAGTIFENTNKPLRDWYRVVHLMLTSKKGMSALQIFRFMGFGSYKTAWMMCHKIRTALIEDIEQLGDIVEADETFVGGLAKNKHKDKRGHGGGTGGIGSGKTPIVGMVKRKGNVIARVVENVRAATLETFVHEAVSHKVSLLCTDQWTGYKHLDDEYPHAVIDHAKEEYVRKVSYYENGAMVVGVVHTQTIEGFWSLIKRGVIGTFYKVSKKYLPLYVAEFQLRYNNRENAGIFGEAIAGC